MYKIVLYFTVLLVLLSIVGILSCSDDTNVTSPNSSAQTLSSTTLRNGEPNRIELDGTQWLLVSVNSSEILKDSHISLYFHDESVWGFSGCNIYGGLYEMEDKGMLSISRIDRTCIGCSMPEGVLDQEGRYYDALQNAAFYYLVGEYLEIDDSKGQQILVFERKQEFHMNPADLVGTSWHLISINGKNIIENLFVTLVFDSECEAAGRAGCFDYKLRYQANGDDIRWGMNSSRSGELPQKLENQALNYLDSLMWGANYRLGTEQLEIFTARGGVLVFEP